MYFENRRLEECTHHAVQIVANLHVPLNRPLDLGSAIIRSAKSTKSNNIPDPNPMPIKDGLRACINVLIESVYKICRQNLSKIKLCDWPNKLDATSWQVLNTTESVGMDRF